MCLFRTLYIEGKLKEIQAPENSLVLVCANVVVLNLKKSKIREVFCFSVCYNGQVTRRCLLNGKIKGVNVFFGRP